MADIATNKQAAYRYHLMERWEAGLVLTGTEVKSLRGGKAQLKDGYAHVQNGEVWLHNVHIPPYAPAQRENHEPERPRKLLMHKREIERLIGKTREKGLTLVPTRLYFKGAAGQGGDRAGTRQGRRRQAPDDQGTRDEARDGARHPPLMRGRVGLVLVAAVAALAAVVPAAGAAPKAHSAIVGGARVPVQSVPWQVYLAIGSDLACGGSVLDATHVLTAAHCVIPEGQTAPRPVSAFTVWAGYDNVRAAPPAGSQKVGVAALRTHPITRSARRPTTSRCSRSAPHCRSTHA